MKTKLLFLATLLCLLVATPLYSQITKRSKTKDATNQKIAAPSNKKLLDTNKIMVIDPDNTKLVPVRKQVVRGRIDPITGEQIPPTKSGPPSKKLAITFPHISQQYPHSNFYVLGESVSGNTEGHIPEVQLHGEGPAGRTVEVKMFRVDQNNKLIQDWTAIPEKISPDGFWGGGIPWGTHEDEGKSVKLKLLVRDAANKSDIITLFVGRE
ncbi:hypothetical protein [Aequorivita sp. KMM 9714]|uniref:hypothetical protein n=1 Tax=Aequorivita sp. KMM 9714 TaxID=2707173 RepID=UPI0013EDBE92|nr:hypothetical protein [Aequorivita sp. KMM 9714]NGX83167.1 hypothetical protein [Aequorivita sp. KMM 9714]